MKENINNTELGKLRIDETDYTTRLSKKFSTRKPYAPEVPGAVLSFIPGTIVEILIQEGSKVNAGDDLIILEAMKMLNRVTCPVNGVVKKVHISKGERVTRGALLIEIE